MNRSVQAKPALLVGIAGAASVGGVLAVGVHALIHSFGQWKIVAVLAAAVVVLSVLVAAVLTPVSRGEPMEPPHAWDPPSTRPGWSPAPRRTQQTQAYRWPSASVPATTHQTREANARTVAPAPTRSPAVATVPPVASPPSSVALQVSTPKEDSWWETTSAERGGAEERAVPGEPGSSDTTVDLSTYAGVTRIVQCPRCGDFRVDVRQQDSGFAFTCRRCAHPWQWRPGAAWPPTVVRPRTGEGPSDTGRATADPT